MADESLVSDKYEDNFGKQYSLQDRISPFGECVSIHGLPSMMPEVEPSRCQSGWRLQWGLVEMTSSETLGHSDRVLNEILKPHSVIIDHNLHS